MGELAVILPTYNSSHFLQESIDSILNQTYANFDLFVYDDGSTDDTESLVKGIDDTRLFYVKNQNNIGLSNTLNRAIEELYKEYEFIARMDADDWAFPDRFEHQIAFLKTNLEIMLCGSQGYWLKELNSELELKWTFPISHDVISKHLLFTACFGHSSIIFRSQLFSKTSLRYDGKIKTCEDWEFWTRIILKNKVANLNLPLMKYRIHKNSNHRSMENKLLHISEKTELIKKYWNTLNIKCNEYLIFNIYFNEDKRTKIVFINDLKYFIGMSNQLIECSKQELNTIELNRIKYRLIRILKKSWINSKISFFNWKIWYVFFKDVKFLSAFQTIRIILR